MKSLPLAYNRDMQEDKTPLFDTIDTLKACIDIYTKMLPKIKIHQDKMLDATKTGFLNATDMADYLVSKGVPFREAHACAGKAVNYAIGKGMELHELDLEELKTFSNKIEKNLFSFLETIAMVDRRKSFGGTATENVKAAVHAAGKDLKNESAGFRT
jgi:argininosuccinate lyase